jgi:hypothetical protein
MSNEFVTPYSLQVLIAIEAALFLGNLNLPVLMHGNAIDSIEFAKAIFKQE